MAYHEGSDSGLVYSTGQGRICPACGRPVGDYPHVSSCRRMGRMSGTPPKVDGIVRIRKRDKGQKGKGRNRHQRGASREIIVHAFFISFLYLIKTFEAISLTPHL